MGATRTFYNRTGNLNIESMHTYKDGKKNLALNLESSIYSGNYIGDLYQTWFVPPKTARYRFYMTCDDKCRVKLAPCPDTTTPLTSLLSHNYASSYRDFWGERVFRKSSSRQTWTEWVQLEKGQNYFLEARYIEYTSGDHFTVGVEIE